MKKYFIAVAAMAFLAACSGKQAQKDVPVEVEEEEFAIMSAAPDAPSLPLIHSVKDPTGKAREYEGFLEG